MSDIVKRIKEVFDDNDEIASWCDRSTYNGAETYTHLIGLYEAAVTAADEITRLRARIVDLEGQHKGLVITNGILRQRDDLPVDRLPVMREVEALRAENERLREALKECEEELDAYYHQDYPTDHPYHQRKLKAALQGNPARAALKENGDE